MQLKFSSMNLFRSKSNKTKCNYIDKFDCVGGDGGQVVGRALSVINKIAIIQTKKLQPDKKKERPPQKMFSSSSVRYQKCVSFFLFNFLLFRRKKTLFNLIKWLLSNGDEDCVTKKNRFFKFKFLFECVFFFLPRDFSTFTSKAWKTTMSL